MEIEYNKKYKYKQICELMNCPIMSSTNSKKSQLSEWQQYYDIEKDGTFYIIKRKYNDNEIKTLPRTDYLFMSNIPTNIFDNYGGVYLIKYDNYVYIGQTASFRKRLYQHISKNKITSSLLQNGGKLYLLSVESHQDKRLELEKYYIQQYKEMGFTLFNQDLVRIKKKQSYSKIKVFTKDLKGIENLLKENNIGYTI